MNKANRARAEQLAHEAALGVLPESLTLTDIALLCWKTDKINPAAMLKFLKGLALYNPLVTFSNGTERHTREGALYLLTGKLEFIGTGKLVDRNGKPFPIRLKTTLLDGGVCCSEDVSPVTKLSVECFQIAWQSAGKRPLSWFWATLAHESVKHESVTEKRIRIVEQVCHKMIEKGELIPSNKRWPRSAIYAECLEIEPGMFSGISEDSASFKRAYSAVRERLK